MDVPSAAEPTGASFDCSFVNLGQEFAAGGEFFEESVTVGKIASYAAPGPTGRRRQGALHNVSRHGNLRR